MTVTDAPTTITFDVYLNIEKDPQGRDIGGFGYEPGQALVHTATITVPATTLDEALNRAYQLLNVGDDPTFGTPDPQAVAYRARLNRSLSIGDVLMADGAARAVSSFGFDPARVDPAQITTVSEWGATSINETLAS